MSKGSVDKEIKHDCFSLLKCNVIYGLGCASFTA